MKNNGTTEAVAYYCAICGKRHESIEERSECETKCIKLMKEKEEERKKIEYENAKDSSEEEICYALDNVERMIAEHLEKFESISLKNNYPYLRYIFKNNIGWWF